MNQGAVLYLIIEGAAIFGLVVVIMCSIITGFITRTVDESHYVRYSIGMAHVKLGRINGVVLGAIAVYFWLRATIEPEANDAPIVSPAFFYGLVVIYLGIVISLCLPSILGVIMIASLKDEIIENEAVDDAADRREEGLQRREDAVERREDGDNADAGE